MHTFCSQAAGRHQNSTSALTNSASTSTAPRGEPTSACVLLSAAPSPTTCARCKLNPCQVADILVWARQAKCSILALAGWQAGQLRPSHREGRHRRRGCGVGEKDKGGVLGQDLPHTHVGIRHEAMHPLCVSSCNLPQYRHNTPSPASRTATRHDNKASCAATVVINCPQLPEPLSHT